MTKILSKEQLQGNINMWHRDLASKINGGAKLAYDPSNSYEFSGVLTSFRRFGKIAFGKLLSTYGSVQFMVREEEFKDSAVPFKDLLSDLVIGAHVRVRGYPALTHTMEPTILASTLRILEKSRSPFPDKWNGVSSEMKRKIRYQETLVNHDVHDVFVKRSRFIKTIRDILDSFGFLEVDTPILHNAACGAQARSFVTNEASSTGHSFNLRIAPETYLKRMTAGGYHKIFEIGKQFRNEGIDPTHMPEFTSCEWYEAYTNASEQLCQFKEFLLTLSDELGLNIGDLCMVEVSFRDLYDQHCPIKLENTPNNEVDNNFKKYVRPALSVDTPDNNNTIYFVTDYPAHLAPLAKRCDHDENFVEMWQMIWKGQEVVKCYTELTDPVLQRQLLEEQMRNKTSGVDEEAMELDEAFLQAMEFGMPPQSGLGFGVDRLFALLYNIDDIRDTVFFPFGQ